MSELRHAELRKLSTQLVRAGHVLWAAGAARRAAWLGRACALLSDPQHPLHRAALAELPASAQLSAQMVEWGLTSTLSTLQSDALLALHDSVPAPSQRAHKARPGQLCVVVLAGNVFSAAAKAVALPLLFGVPVLAKSAAVDGTFAELLARALSDADAELGAAFAAVTFDSQDEQQTQTLFEQADIVSVYGSDNTLNNIRSQLSATVSFIGHGNGLGAAFVGADVLRDEHLARAAAERLALDVAAYDQRGCMSPLVGWLQTGCNVAPQRFAELLHESLEQLEQTLPRGPLPMEMAGAQLSFRGIAAMRGLLLEGSTHAVTYEADGVLRVSPGYRNVQLLGAKDLGTFCAKLSPLGVHLKCLGVAGAPLAAVRSQLPARVAPRLCALGNMQTPKLEALQDGVPAWEGLLRWVEEDSY